MRTLVYILVGVLVIVGLWFWFAGPCETYRFAAASDTPARCLMD